MVPADSHRISRVPRYSGAGWPSDSGFAYAAITLSDPAFQRVPLPLPSGAVAGPTTPGGALRPPRFGLLRVRSPLLAESFLFSLPAGTEMFQFPAFAPAPLVTGSLPPGFPIRTSAHLGAFATTRGFSQLVTSFFASESHRHPPCALSRFPFSFTPFFRLCARFSAARLLAAYSLARLLLFDFHRILLCLRLGLSNLRFHHVNDLCSCGE